MHCLQYADVFSRQTQQCLQYADVFSRQIQQYLQHIDAFMSARKTLTRCVMRNDNTAVFIGLTKQWGTYSTVCRYRGCVQTPDKAALGCVNQHAYSTDVFISLTTTVLYRYVQ
jgi:hypothetical protein